MEACLTKGNMILNTEKPFIATPLYKYAGAFSMVLLHERQLNDFMQTWLRAKAAEIILPDTEDPDYESLEAVLAHVLFSARRYMIWMCDVLELSDPEIRKSPGVIEVEGNAEEYIVHLAEQWLLPLSHIEEERFYHPEYQAPWKVRYCIDAMLEHAVMHPIRHSFQLENLLRNQSKNFG